MSGLWPAPAWTPQPLALGEKPCLPRMSRISSLPVGHPRAVDSLENQSAAPHSTSLNQVSLQETLARTRHIPGCTGQLRNGNEVPKSVLRTAPLAGIGHPSHTRSAASSPNLAVC